MIRVRRGGPAGLLLAGLALLALPLVAAAQETTAGGPSLLLLDRTPWVGEGVDFVVTVEIRDAPPAAQVRLTVHDRVRSRSEFVRALAGEGLRSARYRPPAAPLTTADPDSDGVVTVAVPFVARDGVTPASLPQAGVYPVDVEVLDEGGAVTAVLRTSLVRLPAFDPQSEAVPLDVVVVLPIHAPPVHLDAAPPPAPDVPIADIAAALAAHPTVPLTLVPTPETVDAAAVADPAASSGLVAASVGDQVLAGPWVTLDEASWANGEPRELEDQLERGRGTLVEVFGVQPDRTRLVPVGSTAATVTAMAANGTEALVVPGGDLSTLDDGDFPFTLTRPFALDLDGEPGGDTLPALGSDAGLVAIASTAADDPVKAAGDLLADLAVLASDQPALRRVATFVLPPDAANSRTFLDALLAGLEAPEAPPPPAAVPDPADPAVLVQPEAIPAAAPVVVGRTAVTSLAEIEPAGASGPPDPDDPLVRTLPAEPPPGDVSGVAAAMDRARDDLGSYGDTFGADDLLYADLDLLVATTASAELNGGARAQALATNHSTIVGQLSGLHGPSAQRVTLTAREGRIQLVLTNDTGRPANVTLVLRGDRLEIPAAPDGRLPLQLVEVSTRVDLEVKARSSGDSTLDVVLTTPDERFEIDRTRIVVRTTAVSGVGLLLLGVSFAFLVVWWTRTIVRERRSAKRRHPTHAKGGH